MINLSVIQIIKQQIQIRRNYLIVPDEPHAFPVMPMGIPDPAFLKRKVFLA